MSWWFSAAPGYLLRCVQMHEHAITVTWTCWLHGWLPGGLDSCLWGGLRVTMAMEEHQPLCLSEGKELSCHLNPLSFSPCPLYPWQRSANYSLSGCFSGWVPPTLVSPKALDDVSPHSCLSIDELGLLPTFGEAAFPTTSGTAPGFAENKTTALGIDALAGGQGLWNPWETRLSLSHELLPWWEVSLVARDCLTLLFLSGQTRSERTRGLHEHIYLMLPCLSASTFLGVCLSMS